MSRAAVPDISVIIPTCNRGRAVVAAVESVLAQTYTDYEIIVVDDGSTDDTAERLVPYVPRIRYEYQTNRGASAARNRGVEIARGQWVSFLDSDDLFHPTKLESQRNALRALGDEFGACFTDCGYTGHSQLTRTAFEESGLVMAGGYGALADPLRYHLGRPACFYLQSMMVRRDLLQQLKGFDEEMVVAEDTDLIFRLSFVTKCCIVAAPLVTIDRSPSRGGLMETFSEANDRAALCCAHMFQKWLALPELADDRTRRMVRNALRHTYYTLGIRSLYRYQFGDTLRYLRKLRSMGESYASLASTLLSRAARKLFRRLGPH
jgi:glycosyltransferase involved in cell wall biosynthesis